MHRVPTHRPAAAPPPKEAQEAAAAERPEAEAAQAPARSPAPARPFAARAGAQKPLKDGFEREGTAISHGNLAPVESAQNKLVGSPARPERPPDAFTLLREAKERGAHYTEDATREGHSEDQDDPELAAAVEETIALLFGVRGILRVGPGRDDAGQPVIVVVASQGFAQAALARIPERVHRFPTLLAIPFDLLPLRRER